MFRSTTALLLLLALGASNFLLVQGCGCKKPLYSGSAPVEDGEAIGEVIYDAITSQYVNDSDPLTIGLGLDYKGSDSIERTPSDEDDLCYKLEVRRGQFEVKGVSLTSHLTLVTSATNNGIEINVCRCKQLSGSNEIDFCNIFLRRRIFSRIVDATCRFSNDDNKPDFCCGQ